MYLNKTAELTEQIILVPHIIEMSCRITQRKGDKDAFLQTPEMSLASFAFFPFPNYWTAKSSRCNWKLSKRVPMMARAAFVAVFNERGSLEPVNIAGSIPADRKWRCGLIANSFRGSSWEELLFFIFFYFFPAGCFLCLDIFLPVCGDTCWCREALEKKHKLSCQNDPLWPLKSPGERLLPLWKWGRRSVSQHCTPLGRFSDEARRTETC